MKRLLQLITFSFLSISFANGQNTVGLLSYDQDKAFDGFNLMYPHNQSSVFLIDNCGEIVNEWTDEPNFRPGNMAYLSDEGLLYKGKRDADVTTDPIWAGGGGAILEIRDWDNNLVWEFEMNDSTKRLHHDFSVMPNGNIIALAWELKDLEECLQAGRDTSTLAQDEMWPEWVFEIDPNTDEIIWEWHVWDHLVQFHDDTKDNYKDAGSYPFLVDVNYGRTDGHPDWLHANSIDYNHELNQIMISIPYFDEVWIIDHSTTTEEAASHFGGFTNKGGDIIYRYGNSNAYGFEDTEQKFFFQHDAHWINDFLSPAHPQYNKMGVFNNRVGADYSTANIVNTPWDMYSAEYTLYTGDEYGPSTFDATIEHPERTRLYSTGLSSMQVLPNGNTLITSGRFGYTFELTPSNDIVWEYITPLRGGAAVPQGDSLQINNNLTFRMKRYPTDFVGFEGKDLSSKGWIELEPDSTYCDEITDITEIMLEEMYKIYPNPADHSLTIEWEGMQYARIKIHNSIGHLMTNIRCSGGRKFLDISRWNPGIYFVTVDNQYTKKVVVN